MVALVGYLVPMVTFWKTPTFWTVPFSSLAVYFLFTPLHEAVHRSVRRVLRDR